MLFRISRSLTTATLKAILLKASPAAIDYSLNQIVTYHGYYGWTLLHHVATYHTTECLSIIIDKANKQYLNSAALSICKNSNAKGCSCLSLCFSNRNNDAGILLMNNLSQTTIDDIALKADADGVTFLHHAAYNTSSELFIQIIDRLRAEAIASIIKMKLNKQMVFGENLLHTMILQQNAEAITHTLKKLDKEILTQLLFTKIENCNLFLLLSEYQLDGVINFFLEAMDHHALNKVIADYQINQVTVLHSALLQCKEETCVNLIEVIDLENLIAIVKTTVVMKDICNITGLQAALLWQHPRVAQKLIERIPCAVLTELLLVSTTTEVIAMTSIFQYQPHSIITKCVKSLLSKSYSELVSKNKDRYIPLINRNTHLSQEQKSKLIIEVSNFK